MRPGFSAVLSKLKGDMVAPGVPAGAVAAPGAAATPMAAAGLDIGLEPGTVVSASTIDAHAGVVGVGVGGSGTLFHGDVGAVGTNAQGGYGFLPNQPAGQITLRRQYNWHWIIDS